MITESSPPVAEATPGPLNSAGTSFAVAYDVTGSSNDAAAGLQFQSLSQSDSDFGDSSLDAQDAILASLDSPGS